MPAGDTPTLVTIDVPSSSAQSEVDNRATYTEILTTEKLTCKYLYACM